ncbi:hypothetical protein QCA50_009800 [Cerrena zonata]|uniref:F-box domain-containing protein n=1 Tax=Cerrena zonata TaxID=2478898 RepID=A0AAW0GE29_9APHY
MAPILPPELEEAIMNFLVDHPDALRACALACRSWLATSRMVLFRKITIESETQFDAFEKAAISSPFIQECVRILRIDRSTQGYKLNYPWVNSKLSPILPKQLKRLHAFELVKVEERWKVKSFSSLAEFRNVTKLSIISCGMSPAELYYLIGAFPSLNDLWIEHFVELFSGHLQLDQNSPSFLPTQHLTRLTLLAENLPHGCEDDFFRRILATSSESLRELTIAVGKRDLSSRTRFISSFGSSLQHLDVRFVRLLGQMGSDDPGLVNSFDLAANTGLRSLTLPYPSIPVVFPLLSQVAAPHLERINFRKQIYTLEELDRIDHIALERDLQTAFKSNLRTVKEVRISYVSKLDHDAVLEKLSKAFPALTSRRMLRVVREYERQVPI